MDELISLNVAMKQASIELLVYTKIMIDQEIQRRFEKEVKGKIK